MKLRHRQDWRPIKLSALIVALVAIAGTAFLVVSRRAVAPRGHSHPASTPAPAAASYKVSIPYEDARAILDARASDLPAGLQRKTPAEIATLWTGWVSRHNAEIRARLERGDEDSIVHFWLYGTTFSSRPRATARDIGSLADRASGEDLLLGRLDDLVQGIASPGANERLQFARQVLERKGIDPSTPAGKERARIYLVEARARVVADNDRDRRTADSAKQLADQAARLTAFASLYRDRGLSSDTSIKADFALEQALAAIKSKGTFGAESIRRVAIVGPGLDFTDKAEGYDFYPQQTIQPFALIDSLRRLGLAKPDDFRMITLDLSPRVNQHLDAARQRAARGQAYVLQLPLPPDQPGHQWHPDLVKFWRRCGDRIADVVRAAPPPAGADVRMRAVRVRPRVVLSILPRDLNIVLERLEPLDEQERFDLIVATNILVYYDPFEQALALANVSKMLRPGGFFLTNYAIAPAPPMEPSASLVTMVYFDRQQQNGDTLFWYQRR